MKKLLSVFLCIIIALSAMPLTVGAVDILEEITHLPTTREPYVEVNHKDGTKYQWYKYNKSGTNVDYKNAYVIGDNLSESTYSEKEGWTPFAEIGEQFTYFMYFVIDLQAGDMLIVEDLVSERTNFVLVDYETGSKFAIGGPISENEAGMVAPETASYVLLTASLVDAPNIKATLIRSSNGVAVNGKTSATLNGVNDGIYVCKVTFADGTVFYTNAFSYCDHDGFKADCLGRLCKKCNEYYGTPDNSNHVKWTNGTCVCGEILAITHQPTAQEKYVEVNYPSEATYQWYKYVTVSTEVTNENAYSPSNRYNAQYGWGACVDMDSDDQYIYFRMYLKKGQILVVEPVQKMKEDAKWFFDYPSGINGVLKDGKLYFEVQYDGTFYLKSEGETSSQRVKAYIETSVPTAINGQTSSELTLTDEGKYECKVTFSDSSAIISDRFEIAHAHNFKDYVSNNDATCTKDGTKTAICSCGEEQTVTDLGSKLGHKDSNKDEKCDRCDYVYPHTHSFSAYVSNNDATCTEDGTKTAKCNCGEEKTVTDKGTALGHADEDGDEKCDRCKTDLGQQETCNHFCHSENSFMRIIYIIHRFFFKLLGVSQVCKCGAVHY